MGEAPMRVLVTFGLAWALIALAAAPAQAACDTGNPGAKQLSFDTTSQEDFLGMSMALDFGLSPETFPREDIAKNAHGCPRGSFEAQGTTYHLQGDINSLPERWAERTGGGEVAYLADMPKPKPAYAWLMAHKNDANSQFQFKNDEMMVVLAVTDGTKRRIYAYFDVMPDDATAARAMCAALSGKMALLGSYDERSDVSNFTPAAQTPLASVSGCASN
jgi:hypothetical protein